MTPDGIIPKFDRLFAAEDRHFWFRHRNEVIGDVFRRLTTARPPGYHVLEVGCGNGNVLRVLEQVCSAGTVVGSELHPEGLVHARKRVRCELVTADVYRLNFAEPFDLIGMFDVLEHLPDDVGALAGLRRATRPGGAIALTVPAHMWLWSHVDVAAGHYRRYSPESLAAALRAGGWHVSRVSQFMLPVAPLMLVGRAVAGRRRAAGETDTDLAGREFDIPAAANAALRLMLGFERPVLRRGRGMPVGSSLLAVAFRDPPGGRTDA
jgi:SAM-dependent methyltransferase